MSAETVAVIPQRRLAQLIRPSGYYNRKAEKLKAVAGFMAGRKSVPRRDQLLRVHGIGPETADSILLYAYGEPEFVVDTYTRRILSRFDEIPEALSAGYGKLKDEISSVFPDSPEDRREYHALLVLHAKKYCRKKPLCESCPIAKICRGRKCLQ